MNYNLDVEFNEFDVQSKNKYLNFLIDILFLSVGFFVFVIIKMAMVKIWQN